MTLADEVLTSDCSRYWDADGLRTAATPRRIASFDKQIVRDWLAANWDQSRARRRPCPQEIVEQTAARYRELLDRLTTGAERRFRMPRRLAPRHPLAYEAIAFAILSPPSLIAFSSAS